MDRRTFIKTAVAAATAPVAPAAPAHAHANSALPDLIQRHNTALAADKAAWALLADLEEALASNPDHVMPKVQVGSVQKYGGEKVPRFCYFEEEIVGIISSHMEARVAMCGSHEGLKQHARNGYQAIIDEKVAELRRLTAEHKAREDRAGVTEASKRAGETANAVRALELEIVSFVPSNFEEAVAKAAWVAWAYQDDFCYIYGDGDGSDALLSALQSIAAASVAG